MADVASVAPPPEYCLLWIDWWPLCMTKAEWSGWMQAIGAVLAILFAAGIAWWQANRSERAAAELRRLAERSRLIAIDFSMKRALEAIMVAQLTLANNEISNLQWVPGELEDAMDIINRMPVLEVPEPTLLRHIQRTHRALAHTLMLVRYVENAGSDERESARLAALETLVGRLKIVTTARDECAKLITQWTLPRDSAFSPKVSS